MKMVVDLDSGIALNRAQFSHDINTAAARCSDRSNIQNLWTQNLDVKSIEEKNL